MLYKSASFTFFTATTTSAAVAVVDDGVHSKDVTNYTLPVKCLQFKLLSGTPKISILAAAATTACGCAGKTVRSLENTCHT